MNRRAVLLLILPPVALSIAYLAKAGDLRASADAAGLVRAARAETDWAKAFDLYAGAAQRMELRPVDPAERYRLKLAVEYARARTGGIVEALINERQLLDDASRDPNAGEAVRREVRRQLAATRYYTAWLMRRDGAPRAEWLPLADAARQDFRYLAERAMNDGGRDWQADQSDLETVLRFVRQTDAAANAEAIPDPALGSNAGRTRPPEDAPERPERPSEGDGRNRTNGTDPSNQKPTNSGQRPYTGS